MLFYFPFRIDKRVYIPHIRDMTTTQNLIEANEAARDALDFWEHYTDHAGFIAEVGGQEAFDAEYARRCAAFFALNCNA